MEEKNENVRMSDEQIAAKNLVDKFFYATLLGCGVTLIVVIGLIVGLYNLIKWLF